MKLKKGKKHNNKGFTLTEVLVALAVSSVVITIVIAFISQGSRFYKTQSNTINLQNELQETSNVITDTLQEATYLSITSNSKNLEVYTGSYVIKEGKKEPEYMSLIKLIRSILQIKINRVTDIPIISRQLLSVSMRNVRLM